MYITFLVDDDGKIEYHNYHCDGCPDEDVLLRVLRSVYADVRSEMESRVQYLAVTLDANPTNIVDG